MSGLLLGYFCRFALLVPQYGTLTVTTFLYPYLYNVISQNDIMIDAEHFEYEWIRPESLSKYDTVPGLQEALERVICEEE
jgi:hypothetical protein